MARQKIPGFSCVPVDTLNDPESFSLMGFNLRSFTVPGPHKYGNCRPVTEFQKLRKISGGTFGNVYKVKDTATDEIYALKKLHIQESNPAHPKVMPQNFLRMMNNLKTLKHINIVNLKEVVVGKSLESQYLVVDYCKYSLENVIDQVDIVYLQHRQIKNIMLQLLFGLECIHSFNIIHRDLRPKNILFTDSGTLKISDFASSRKATKNDMSPNTVARWYRAPEILLGSTKYTTAIDIWAVGCILAEMILQKPLLRGNADGSVVRSMIDVLGTPTARSLPGFEDLPVPKAYHLRKQPYNTLGSIFSNQTIPTVNYLKKLLKYDPALRPNANECQKDLYYDEYPRKCTNEELLETLHFSDKL